MERATYLPPSAEHPLVISASALALFQRCRKAYQLSYEERLEVKSSEAAEQGIAVHAILAAWAKGEDVAVTADDYPMLEVAKAYVAHHPLPDPESILGVETPIYTKLFANVWLRTTFDLHFSTRGHIRIRDYKTFEKWPSYDADLDFKHRLYLAIEMRATRFEWYVDFEFHQIRRVPPGTKNSKGHWTPEECYRIDPIVISREEAELHFQEAVDTARDLVRARKDGRWYRTFLSGTAPHSCHTCWWKEICKSELSGGGLTDDNINLLTFGRKDAIELPEALRPKPRKKKELVTA